MKYNFVVNIDSIKKLSNGIKAESGSLNDILDYLINITGEMNTFFDTPTSKIFNKTLLSFLNDAKKPCQNLDELSNRINAISNTYENLSIATKRSFGDDV